MEEHENHYEDHHQDQHEPGFYEIRVDGHLDDRRAAWFEGLTITRQDNGDTVLAGQVVDQAALHGLLRKVRDLGMPLLSVTLVRWDQAETKPGRMLSEDKLTGGSARKGEQPLRYF